MCARGGCAISRSNIFPNFRNDAEQADNAQQLHDNVMSNYNKVPRAAPRFKVGQTVRILLSRENFAKTYDDLWSEQLYQISKIHTKLPRPMYEVSSDVAGKAEPIEGRFYGRELQVVTPPEIYKIDKVLKEKGVGRNKTLYVSWYGYGPEHNSWIPASNLSKRYAR